MIKGKQREKYFEEYKDFEKLTADKLAINLIRPNTKVLSCGCGQGREVKFLVQEKHCKVTAIDIEQEMVDLSKKEEPNAEYYVGNMINFIAKKKQDYILCIWNGINALSTKENRVEFIKNCENNLKENGQIILVTSNMFSYWKHLFSELKYRDGHNYFPSEIDKWFKGTKLKHELIRVGRFNIIIAK
jgi:2-polyprenyl-3-methyl-5-hydroxy-6-metoxy-1,4-benzoquinol methylase